MQNLDLLLAELPTKSFLADSSRGRAARLVLAAQTIAAPAVVQANSTYV